eukprot:2235876-Pyramimonas_sp.AAC.1
MRWKRRGRGRVNLPALASCDFAAVFFLLAPLLSSKKPLLWGDILWRSRLLAIRSIAKEVPDASSARDYTKAHASLRALGASGKRREQLKVLPSVKLPDGTFAPTAPLAHQRWMEHFAGQELAAV